MALGNSTASDFAGAASDLFSSQLNADSDRISAQGTRIKAAGDIAEGQTYGLAATLAQQNEQFAEQSTAIQQTQAERQIYQTIGQQQAEVGAQGGEASGSALDILRSSAQQGALTHQVIGQQGLITEAGYNEQAQSYQIMQAAANSAASAEQGIADQQDSLASKTALYGEISAGIKTAAGIATLFT